ncbi:PTS sugar transporter subunit IIA [Enterococcus faecium]|uniref:PTS sugar transporter subunit IIA n=1 Tax=Enterococcus faecium TaxID=1352 RepID=UPI000A32BCE9|nr:PTS sugar transporter subunit IIA [Enterococcus faecium]EGP4929801.1 PTS transporter subunit EIIA [Enterococcus faecium]EGP5218540.1 PTS sugar transporter subunit IIA [Enterococcus faecium]EGV6194112.1 PTS transporter subunit EIIA [Enterococcus faecium]NTQ03436.1 PTS sugar transporter subunit IIA [Enterococcus faecium]NTQ13945.1 PTS sugar transporter subunit IIA [Enterococcus faecium]
MLKEQLSGNTMFMDAIDSWQEAIRVSARPLIGKGIIEESYVQAMIQNVLDNGNYIILLPLVAMPHARPEFGSKGVGMSFLCLDKPVMFPSEEPVRFFFTFSSDSPKGHLDLMANLGELLSDEKMYQKLFDVKTEKALLDLIKK